MQLSQKNYYSYLSIIVYVCACVYTYIGFLKVPKVFFEANCLIIPVPYKFDAYNALCKSQY